MLRNSEPVALTPKVFDTLEILVENSGQLLTKDDLMKTIWQDQFVEESNLTSNIKMIRKALGDDAAHPQFIETVPRRGYRFIADVAVAANGNGIDRGIAIKIPQAVERKSTEGLRFHRLAVAAIVVLSAAVMFSAYLFSHSASDTAAAPILSSSFASEKLSTNGKVLHAVITPDGKSVIYTNGWDGQQSLWIRNLETSNNVEIVPPSNDAYFGLAVSPDGGFIYFVRRPKSSANQDIYRVPIFGGIPAKIANSTEGWISISPDGGKISFVRCPYADEEFCSLWVADSENGKNERKLTVRSRPMRIGDNEFAPDGKSIAFAVGQSQNQANEFGLMEIDVESGAERDISAERFFNIKSLTWLPNRSGLLITASRVPNKHFRIWEVSTATGGAQALTNDSESYNRLSLNNDANMLISTQVSQDFQMFVINGDETTGRSSLADASQVTFAKNGRIFFSSVTSGNDEIWSINSDGSDSRQLTNDSADDGAPTISPSSDLVFFASNRTGNSQVWRMNVDGSNQVQITYKDGGRPIFVSPDGRWVYYRHGLLRTLWRVSSSGGEEKEVFNKKPNEFAISPDGSQVAFFEQKDDYKTLEVASIADGSIVKSFRIADQTPAFNMIAWMPDGEALIYVLSADGKNNVLWLQPIKNAPPKKIVDLGTEEINSMAVAPDGKSFAIVRGSWKHDAVLIKGLK
ncbi:MAG: winged helix-turn-helix domain-containing protein [Pyrinomonadaceae bacterium]